MPSENKFAFEVPGKLEIPYRYYAGECGSRFLTALRDQKKFLARRCPHCRTVFMPPRSLCTSCFKRTSDWVEVGPQGTVVSFTVVRYSEPHQPRRVPYLLALVKLDGADTALLHLLDGIEPDQVKIGMRVQAVFAPERKARITDVAYFRPVAAQPARPKKAQGAKKPVAKSSKKPAARAKKKTSPASRKKTAPAAAAKSKAKTAEKGRKRTPARGTKQAGSKSAGKQPGKKAGRSKGRSGKK